MFWLKAHNFKYAAKFSLVRSILYEMTIKSVLCISLVVIRLKAFYYMRKQMCFLFICLSPELLPVLGLLGSYTSVSVPHLLYNDQHESESLHFTTTNMKHGRSHNLPCIAPCMLCLRHLYHVKGAGQWQWSRHSPRKAGRLSSTLFVPRLQDQTGTMLVVTYSTLGATLLCSSRVDSDSECIFLPPEYESNPSFDFKCFIFYFIFLITILVTL